MEREILKVKTDEAVSAASASSFEGPEEYFFCFVRRGPKAAYRKIEEYIRGKTSARLIFQRVSKRYLAVSDLQTKQVFPTASNDLPDSLPGCFTYYGSPEWPNGPCETCRVKKLCRDLRGGTAENE